jgi:hypothetical protein
MHTLRQSEFAAFAAENQQMACDGISRLGALMEQKYAHQSDRALVDEGRIRALRQSEFDEIRIATRITDVDVLTELIDCGVRANSLHILTLVPLVHVAWSNGHIERQERLAILNAAELEGVRSDAPGFQVLDGWLRCRPPATLLKTWMDYVAAIRLVVTAESFNTLHIATIARARQVAEAAGGILGFNKVSRAEETAIQQLNQAFIQ